MLARVLLYYVFTYDVPSVIEMTLPNDDDDLRRSTYIQYVSFTFGPIKGPFKNSSKSHIRSSLAWKQNPQAITVVVKVNPMIEVPEKAKRK